MAILQKNNKYNSKVQGFSLVEMAVVLGIVGALGAGMGLMYSEQKTQAEWQASKPRLEVVKSAILKFAEVNKYMPCPSDPLVATGTDDRNVLKGMIPAIPAIPATPAVPKTYTAPTIPAIPSQGAQPAISNIDVSTCNVHIGNVPYAALGLSKADVQDSWGNPFIYAVDQGVTSADNMLNCPTATACFFNKDPIPVLPAGKVFPGSVLPAFDTSTQPLQGVLGADNLEICTDTACSTGTQAQGLVAVLLATNDDSNPLVSKSAGETQNLSGGKTYVNQTYSKSPFYDDTVIGISAYEIENSASNRIAENVISPPPPPAETPPVVKTGTDLNDLGVGSSGTNVGTDTAIWDRSSQSFDFGADSANQKVVLKYDSHAVGSWDQPKNGNGVTSDTATVTANGQQVEEYKYDYTDNTQNGSEAVSWVFPVSGWYYESDANGNLGWIYANAGETVNGYADFWNASHESVVTLNSNGQINLDFAAGTTATYETIDFTNIQLVYYDTPPDMPSFPKVAPISGVTQSEGLN